MDNQFDVIVVGAGPVGLLLAIELKLGGARVMVLERLVAPDAAIKGTAIGPLGVEALQRRGMGAALADAEARAFAAMGPMGAERRAQNTRSRGHFAVLPLRSDVERDRRMVWVEQQVLENILVQRSAALGIEVRRGCEVTGIEPSDDGVAVHWTSANGAGHGRCAWLVGCDGGRSAIRKLARFDFPGTPPSITMYQAVLDLDHPERLPRGFTRMPAGAFMHGPRPRRLSMHDYSGPPADRKAPVTREEIEGVLRRISGADVRVTALEQAHRFTDSARLVDSYRRGRVLLAGDAAHIHSPLGGQGLSLGLVDAANLGWKLAAVIRGDKSEALLDSYTSERRPVAESVLANTLAQVALLRPDPQSAAMRNLFEKLLELDDVNGFVDGLTSGLSTRYDLGAAHDSVGRLIRDRTLDDSSLFAELGRGEGLLLDASDDARAARVVAVFANVRRLPVEADLSMLIRPDGCVAWASDAGGVEGLAGALDRWFARRP